MATLAFSIEIAWEVTDNFAQIRIRCWWKNTGVIFTNTASNFTIAELPFTVVDQVESCLLLQGVVSGSFEQTRST